MTEEIIENTDEFEKDKEADPQEENEFIEVDDLNVPVDMYRQPGLLLPFLLLGASGLPPFGPYYGPGPFGPPIYPPFGPGPGYFYNYYYQY